MSFGGDRTSGYTHAKHQLFRTLDDVNPDPRLAELEASIMSTANGLGIGTIGFGGNVMLALPRSVAHHHSDAGSGIRDQGSGIVALRPAPRRGIGGILA